LAFKHLDFSRLFQSCPSYDKRGKGSYETVKITPFIPLTLRGRFKENTYFKGDM